MMRQVCVLNIRHCCKPMCVSQHNSTGNPGCLLGVVVWLWLCQSDASSKVCSTQPSRSTRAQFLIPLHPYTHTLIPPHSPALE